MTEAEVGLCIKIYGLLAGEAGNQCSKGRTDMMTLKETALMAMIVTAAASTFFAAVLATPVMLTQLLFGAEAFVGSAFVLFVLLQIPWLRTLPAARQRLVIWLAAGTAGAIVCFLPLTF